MSTHDEIMAVYHEEINSQSSLVESKFGKAPFYDNFNGFSIKGLYDNLGIEQIKCADFTPRTKRATKKVKKQESD